MAARSSWKGYLKLSLVSVPVKAYTLADSAQKSIHLNQLHKECNSRIRYLKTCPIHGEIDSDEIVSAYQIGKDQYVPIDPDELDAIRPQSDQSIEIDTFITDEQLDDRFLTDRSYYLVPDGKVAQKPYALIRQALEEEKLRAIAEIILSKREQHVLVRPQGKLLMMTVLQHQTELKEPTVFEDEVDDAVVAQQELSLTKQLVAGLTRAEWDYGVYVDDYQKRLSDLIAAKVEGKELVKPPETEAPAIINLMDALKASIEKIEVPKGGDRKSPPAESAVKQKTKPARRTAPSTPRTPSKGKRSTRKTG